MIGSPQLYRVDMAYSGFPRTLPSSLLCLMVVTPLSLVLACGGSASESKTANEPTPEPTTDNLGTYPDSGEAEEVDLGCTDGTCFACADGLCPKGAYCDQDAQGGGACAWLSECPGSPTCACLAKVLGSSCNCDESSGGPLVSCH